MRFQKICDQLCPVDQDAIDLYAGLQDGDVIDVEVVVSKRRTGTQNNSLHKWLALLAEALNAAGLDMKTVLKPEVEIPWTKESAKLYLWRPIQKAMLDKDSTTDATTVEYPQVYATLTRHLSQKFGLYVPEWPSKK